MDEVKGLNIAVQTLYDPTGISKWVYQNNYTLLAGTLHGYATNKKN
jgi:hypothetical protein